MGAESIPLSYNPPNMFSQMSTLLDTARAAQAYQMGNMQMQQLGQQVAERQAVAQALQDPSIRNPDGSINLNIAGPKIMSAAPAFYGPGIVKQLTDTAKENVGIQQNQFNLTKDQWNHLSTQLGSLSQDPNIDKNKVMNWALDMVQSGQAPLPLATQFLQGMPDDPKSIQQWLITHRLGALSAADQANQMKPGVDLRDTGGQLTGVQTNPYAGPVGQIPGLTVQKSLTPEQTLPKTGSDAFGNPIYYNPQNPAQSGYIGGQNAPIKTPSTEPATQAGAKRANDLIAQAQNSPARINVLDNIISLTHDIEDNGGSTGPGTERKAQLYSVMGNTIPGFANLKTDAQRYETIGKYLEQNALIAWQAAGGTGSNAQLESEKKANGDLAYQPGTIRRIAEWSKAGELALQIKTNAQDNWLNAHGNNYATQSQFENAWRNNFDPRVFQLEVMNPADKVKMLNSLTPKDAAALIAKRSAMMQLGGASGQ